MAQPTQTDPQFKLRLPAALKERISATSAANNRSMNAEIVSALEAAFPPPNEDIADILQELNQLQIELMDSPSRDELENLASGIDFIAISLMQLDEKLRKISDGN